MERKGRIPVAKDRFTFFKNNISLKEENKALMLKNDKLKSLHKKQLEKNKRIKNELDSLKKQHIAQLYKSLINEFEAFKKQNFQNSADETQLIDSTGLNRKMHKSLPTLNNSNSCEMQSLLDVNVAKSLSITNELVKCLVEEYLSLKSSMNMIELQLYETNEKMSELIENQMQIHEIINLTTETQFLPKNMKKNVEKRKNINIFGSTICVTKSALTQSECKQVLNNLIEEVMDSSRGYEEALNTWRDLSYSQQKTLLHYLLMDHLHLAEVNRLQRKACANIFAYLMRKGVFKKAVFVQAYEKFAKEFADLLVDVPNGWTYVFEFLGPILHERLLLFSDIWCPQWSEDSYFTERFLKAMILHFTMEFGVNYMRNLWHKEYKLGNGQQFLKGATEFRDFLNVNDFKYIEQNYKANKNEQQPRCIQNHSIAEQLERIGFLLNSADNCDLAIDYINTNVQVNLEFSRNLTKFLCCDYATFVDERTLCEVSSTRQLRLQLFYDKCIPLMRLCKDKNETNEIDCLHEIVDSLSQVYDEATANNLTYSIFEVLHFDKFISQDTFEKWYSRPKGDRSMNDLSDDFLNITL